MPLHDPHLKSHLTAEQRRRRLYRGGFITKDGKVLCTLKEYNNYRQYLRKVNLCLQKKRVLDERDRHEKLMKQRREREAASMVQIRNEKIQEVKRRLSTQSYAYTNKYVCVCVQVCVHL